MAPLKNIKIVFLSLCFLFSLSVYSQKNDSSKFDLWAAAGIGIFGASGESAGIASNIDLNLYKGETLYKIRYLNLFEFDLFGPTPSEKFHSYSALMGKGIYKDHINLIFSAGLGVTTGIRRGDLIDEDEFERDYFFTPSIPLEIDVLWKITKFIAPNFTLFMDLNIKKPYLGYMIKLSLGKLK